VTTTDEAVGALQVFKNVILEGPPGTGKSYSIAAIASAWPRLMGTSDDGEPAKGNGSWAVTFHPSTSYEEFVEGIRYNPHPSDPKDPDSKARGFELRSGVFRSWIRAARAAPNRDFLVLIDEINRANVSKVLGDLLLGLEASKRLRHDPTCTRTDKIHEGCWSDGVTTQLPYSNDLLGVPDNLYLLGTMNSSDRSIAPLDAALRRRFAFIRVSPLSGDELKSRLTEAHPGVGTEVIERSVDALDSLNEALSGALGPNSTLGHSYLFELGSASGAPRYWMEVDSVAVATGSQLQVTKEWAKRLLQAAGSSANVDARGRSVDLHVHYDGSTYQVRLENPNHGNVRFSGGAPFSTMSNGVTIWRPSGVDELALEYLPSSATRKAARKAMVADHEARSDWKGQSPTRSYGRFRSDTDDRGDGREKAVWRYAILPQLLESVTQAFSLDLLTSASRQTWLDANLTPTLAEQVAQSLGAFETFLNGHLGLQISLVGHGLSAALVIEELQEIEELAEVEATPAETAE
jgi:MoxR-like ATPase